jgi:copper homeostasis protein
VVAFKFHVEVCLERPEDALLAEQAGATRIELNSALSLDGLTPTLGACRWLKQNCNLPLIAMLRPHAASFVLSSTEQTILLHDCEDLLACGVQGIAYGALSNEGTLQLDYFNQVARLCGPRELVCHRAFDQVHDQRRGLEQLIDCGVRRVLTSGGAATAELGVGRLRQLIEWSGGRIEILPGAGIHSGNVRKIVELTGCDQVHGTFRGLCAAENRPTLGCSPTEITKIRSVLEKLQDPPRPNET